MRELRGRDVMRRDSESRAETKRDGARTPSHDTHLGRTPLIPFNIASRSA